MKVLFDMLLQNWIKLFYTNCLSIILDTFELDEENQCEAETN